MIDRPRDLVALTIAAAECEIVGRVRFQKIVYLLDQLGLGSGLTFSYHHYGPYSRTLDDAIDAAKALNGVQETIRHRVSDGAPFSVFTLPASPPQPVPSIGAVQFEAAQRWIREMKGVSSTVLELAATIHWLFVHENLEGWRDELRRRKGVKTENGRMEEAEALLRRLGLGVTAQTH